MANGNSTGIEPRSAPEGLLQNRLRRLEMGQRTGAHELEPRRRQKDGSFKYGKPLYSNQRVIFQHSVKVGDWKGGVMRTPPKDWQSYTDRNEVGSYRRTFTIPAAWKGMQVCLNFDGVDSFFYLYVNGKYVGFSKNSRNLAQFDITPYLNEKGENLVAVEVYRHSDGSFLESQDMFRLPGIFRTVSLTAQTAGSGARPQGNPRLR